MYGTGQVSPPGSRKPATAPAGNVAADRYGAPAAAPVAVPSSPAAAAEPTSRLRRRTTVAALP